MVETRTDYAPDAVAAARAVMLELVRLLGEYRDDMVIVGGWVPELLLPAAKSKHIGSTDVDVALDYHRIVEAGYQTIREHLLRQGYVAGTQPFTFFREVVLAGRTIPVKVDFLAGEYGGAGRSHRTQSVQDMAARKARGCDLALEDEHAGQGRRDAAWGWPGLGGGPCGWRRPIHRDEGDGPS